MRLLDLPVELHQNISSFLSQPDLYALSQACHDLYDVCYPILWEAISFIDQFPTIGIDRSVPASHAGPQLASPDICYACTISAPRPVSSGLIASKYRCYHSQFHSFQRFLEGLEEGEISLATSRLVKVLSIFDMRGTFTMTKLIARLARTKPRNALENVSSVQLFVTNSSPKPIDSVARFLRPTDKFYLIQDTMRNPMQLTKLISNKKAQFFYTLRWLDITIGTEDDMRFVNGVLQNMVNLEFLCVASGYNPGFHIDKATFAALTKLERFKVSGEVVTTLKSLQAASLLPVTKSIKFDLSLHDDTDATHWYQAQLEEALQHMNDQRFEHIESCSFLWSHMSSWNRVYISQYIPQVPVKYTFPNVTKLELWLAKYEQEKTLIRACPRLKQLLLKEISLESLEFVVKCHPQLKSLSFSMVTPEGDTELPEEYSHLSPSDRQHQLLYSPEKATMYTKLLLTTLQKFKYLEFLAIGYQEVTAGKLTGEDFYWRLRECIHLAQVALMIPTKGFYSARSKLLKTYKDDASGIMSFFTEGRYIYIGKLCYNALYLDVPNFKHSMEESLA